MNLHGNKKQLKEARYLLKIEKEKQHPNRQTIINLKKDIHYYTKKIKELRRERKNN